MILLCLLSLARAAEQWVVRPGDTVEGLAAAIGHPELAGPIRALNGLAPLAQPQVGQLLVLPEGTGAQHSEAALVSWSGQGSVRRPSQPPLPFSDGLLLPPGSTVCTESHSFATVRLASGLRGPTHDDVSLLPGTCITVDSASSRGEDRSSVLSLASGSVSVQTSEAGGGRGRITVRTQSGLTTGEGGGFRVHIETDAARTEALFNPLSVIGAGVAVDVKAGQGSRTRSGEAPSTPVDLLLPPSLLSPAAAAPLRRPDFSWADEPLALGFQIELSRDADFRDVVVMERLDRPNWQPQTLLLSYDLPGLYWRVSAFDRLGFLGMPADPRPFAFPAGVGP